MGHSHSHGDAPSARASQGLRLFLLIVVAFVAGTTVVAARVLWPSSEPVKLSGQATAATTFLEATVTKVQTKPCGPMTCEAVAVRLDEGLRAGDTVDLTSLTPSQSTPLLQVDDKVVVTRDLSLDSNDFTYTFADYQRRSSMWLLAAVFAVIVVVIARWRGAAALIGVGITWLILVTFMLPALLQGESPIAVALTASAMIMFVVLYLAHGVNARTTTALLGTLASLSLTGVLSWVFVNASHFSGLASDEAAFLAQSGSTIQLSGLLLCGMIIGSLGVLNDVTVTQASAVWEIHSADPSQTAARLYRSGMRIGRDHIASTVYTLVLAYAGATLPLLILFVVQGEKFGDIATLEIVAEEIVRTLVGTIGLIASVPLTTALAAAIVTRRGAFAHEPDDPAMTSQRVTGVGPKLAAGTATMRTRRREASARKQQRQAGRAAREAAKEAQWQAPAAEREFWDR